MDSDFSHKEDKGIDLYVPGISQKSCLVACKRNKLEVYMSIILGSKLGISMPALPWSHIKMTQSVMSAQHINYAVDAAHGKGAMFIAGSISGPVFQRASHASSASFGPIILYSGERPSLAEILISSAAGSRHKDQHLTGSLADVSFIRPIPPLTSTDEAAKRQICMDSSRHAMLLLLSLACFIRGAALAYRRHGRRPTHMSA